jgi:protein TonB
MEVSMQEGAQTEVAVDARKFPFSYYLSAIERRVSENWLSAAGGREGGVSCVVYFRLSRNGRVSDLRIETPSGDSYFDRSALRAIRSAEPFPPLPRAFGESWLGIHFTFTQKK